MGSPRLGYHVDWLVWTRNLSREEGPNRVAIDESRAYVRGYAGKVETLWALHCGDRFRDCDHGIGDPRAVAK